MVISIDTPLSKPVRKRRQKGWQGTSSATRTRKSPPRNSRPAGNQTSNKSYPIGPKAGRITQNIHDIWPILGAIAAQHGHKH